MKKYLVTLLLTFCYTLSFAQSQSTEPEKTKPMRDTEIVRNVSIIDIEGSLYNDVEVTIKSISADYLIYDNDRVKVTMKKGKRYGRKHSITHICMFLVTVKYKLENPILTN